MIIQSITRVSKILSLFTFSKPNWGLSEIATAVGLARGTVHNIAQTLVVEGLLDQDPDSRKYSLGARFLTLGTIMAGTLEINQKAGSLASRLSSKTGFICHVGVWNRDAAIVTFKISPNQKKSWARVGPQVPAYCSAIGRSLLVHLDQNDLKSYLNQTKLVSFTSNTITIRDQLEEELEQTRLRGYAVNNQEISLGRGEIAATIFKAGNKLGGAISLSGDSDLIFNNKRLKNLTQELMNVAGEISTYMGYSSAIYDQH